MILTDDVTMTSSNDKTKTLGGPEEVSRSQTNTIRPELQSQQSKHGWSIWKLHPLTPPPHTPHQLGQCGVEDLKGTAASQRL